MNEGLKINSYFSEPYDNPYEDPKGIIKYSPRKVTITDDSGKVTEILENCIFPEHWSPHAASITATKYFRKEGVPGTGREIDIRQLVGRVAKKISQWGTEQGYVMDEYAKKLEDEIVALSIGQYGAFNSPVWFNLGLDLYGITKNEELFYVDNGKVTKAENSYANPQVSACFISSPKDSIEDMVYVGVVTSSRIFKWGSGIGGDWSKIRSAGELVSGGGYASGADRFMDLQDSTARVIKSGGKTRRAATMQSLGVWHPDLLKILSHKYKEEEKARVLIEAGSPSNWESHTIQDLRAQNVNISVRIDDAFWRAYENDEKYFFRGVTDGKATPVSARELARIIAFTTYSCGDPGVQNHSIINKWNTCKTSGEIWASNPCSEYMFLNNSACNLASMNLLRFRKSDGSFDLDSFERAIDIYITAQDILVSRASYPTEDIAWNSHIFRPLGLGYANLGAYIMSLGLPYDSNESRDFAAAITSNMTAEAYLQSIRLARTLGPFQEYDKNKESMLEVLNMHRKAARQLPRENSLESLVDSANKKWDEVIEEGKKYGFRNAQVTLLAPTGTIGFMMGCDTTGCEPEYSLKKYKELAGGGSMTIVNETIPLALERLGYDNNEISKIREYIEQKGTIEGCSIIKPEHISVFDCAVSSGDGIRAISPIGHIKMLGAIQPHISGAISKTINCPSNTSVEEIEEMFYQGWKNGVKAVAIYRDGSKASQPLRTERTKKLEILARGEREHLPELRGGIIQKVKIGGISLFITTGEYSDGRIGELFIESLERGSEVNRLLNENAIQFSEKLQYGVSLEESLEIFQKAGNSQIAGITNHQFIKTAKGPEGFIYDWVRAHYLGDVSFVLKDPEMRPLPWELRVYQKVPRLHLIPSVEGEIMYPGVPSLEETIKRISKTNYWEDSEDELDTRQTIERIKRRRVWKNENNIDNDIKGRITGKICDKCGGLMVSDGGCFKCPKCRMSTGGCGGG